MPVPPGVRYQAAGPEQDKAALDRFRRVLEQSEMVPSPIMLGPILSQKLDSLNVGEVLPGTFQLPLVEGALICKGWVLRGEEATADVSRKLKDLVGEDPTFRRPNSTEMKYYWALAPFDLEGSIFVCEGNKAKLFWNFVGDEMSYLEDVSDIGETFDSAMTKLTQLPETIEEPQIQTDHIAALNSGGSVPEPLQGLEKVVSSTVILLTPEELLELRTTSDDLAGYLKPILEKSQNFARENNLKQSLVQIDLSPGREPVLRVGGRPRLTEEARASLLAELKSVAAPQVKGPVCLFSVECPE